MKLNKILSAALAALMVLGLTACQPAPPADSSGSQSPSDTSSSIREEDSSAPVELPPFALAFYPELSLHPVLSGNRANLTLAPLLYEPLFALDEHFQPQEVLCSSYSVSPDKLVWTFRLQPGVSFSNSTPLTGGIVAAALEQARQPGSRYAQRLRDVASIVGTDDSVTITLNRPNGRFHALLDIPIALDTGLHPAGTGPYVLSGSGEDMALAARMDWWQADRLNVPAGKIPLHTFKKSEELSFAFDAGDVSLVDVDLLATDTPGYSSSCQTWDYATTDLLYLGFNTQKGLCRTPEVRRAISHTIDRETVAKNIFATHAVPSALPVHPDSPLYDRELADTLSYDPQLVHDQLQAANAQGRELTMIVNAENYAKVGAAQMISYQLQAAGISVNLQKLAFDAYQAALTAGSFDLYIGEVVLTADFDLSPLLAADGPLNYGGWAHPEAWYLFTSKAALTQEAPQAASPLLKLIAQDAPIAPIVFKNGSVLTQRERLTGMTPVRGNVFYQLQNWLIK